MAPGQEVPSILVYVPKAYLAYVEWILGTHLSSPPHS